MEGNVPDKMMLLQKIKKGSHADDERTQKAKKNNRLLITVTVLGSAGPIRFMVNKDDPVSWVIDATLKSYAREGRLPALGSNPIHFFLCCSNDFEAMSSTEAIGSKGGRNFVLCKKAIPPRITEDRTEMIPQEAISGGSGSWKAWLKKSFSFNVQFPAI